MALKTLLYPLLKSLLKLNRIDPQECEGNLPAVPLHLRNASTKLMKDLGYGKGYSFDATEREKLNVTYMPDEMGNVDFFAKSK